jgi:hypothetical protein
MSSIRLVAHADDPLSPFRALVDEAARAAS